MNINILQYPLQLKKENQKIYVWDIIRKKYVRLTPEEEVRQRFIHFLVNEKKYPQGLMQVEKELKIYNLKKRADIVLYNPKQKVQLLVECKAPQVQISQKTFDQIARYNMKFHSDYLIVTNGKEHYCCRMNNTDKTYQFVRNIPEYKNIKQ